MDRVRQGIARLFFRSGGWLLKLHVLRRENVGIDLIFSGEIP